MGGVIDITFFRWTALIFLCLCNRMNAEVRWSVRPTRYVGENKAKMTHTGQAWADCVKEMKRCLTGYGLVWIVGSKASKLFGLYLEQSRAILLL